MPVVYEHSPYRGDTGNPANHDVDFDTLAELGSPHGVDERDPANPLSR